MAELKVLGVKHGVFKDEKGSTIPFHQIALDMGTYLKIFKVKDQQSKHLDLFKAGDTITGSDGFVADKYFIFL